MMLRTGLGLRPAYYAEVLNAKTQVPWFEVITENYMSVGSRPFTVLEEIRKDYPLALHGVSLSIGSIDNLDEDYLHRLKMLIHNFSPVIVSDHLSWSRHNGVNSHDLLPLVYNSKNLKRLISRINYVQDKIGHQMIFENPTLYVQPKYNEMRESEFLRELCLQTGCGVLLDVNNLVVNRYNLDIDYKHYINDLIGLDVLQIHVAGHQVRNDIRIDTHDQVPLPETLQLLKIAREHWPDARPLLEWDDNLPPFSELVQIAQEIDLLSSQTKTQPQPPKVREIEKIKVPVNSDSTIKDNLAESPYYNYFMDILFSPDGADHETITRADLFSQLSNLESGLGVYNSGFYLRALAALKNIYPRLSKIFKNEFDEIVKQYLIKFKPKSFSIDFIGRDLVRFLQNYTPPKKLGVPLELLTDLARLENSINEVFWAEQKTALSLQELAIITPSEWSELTFGLLPSCQIFSFEYPIVDLINALDLELDTEACHNKQTQYVLVYRDINGVQIQSIEPNRYHFLKALSQAKPIPEFMLTFLSDHQITTEHFMAELQKAVQAGLLTKLVSQT